MNKTLMAGIVGIVFLAAILVGVQAYGSTRAGTVTAAGEVRGCEYSARMQQVIETGSYDDLVALRAESGRPMMPHVTDEQTFLEAKERHTEAVAQYGAGAKAGNGCGMMGAMHEGEARGMSRGSGRAQKHNCPLMDDGTA